MRRSCRAAVYEPGCSGASSGPSRKCSVSENEHCPGPPTALPCRAMWTLVGDLDAFLQEHRRCGEMDGSVEGERVWMTCDGCGAVLSRSLLSADRLPPGQLSRGG
jgi:hypothetical protein